MKSSQASLPKKGREYLMNNVVTQLCGLTMGEWLTMLGKHHFSVDAPYIPRAALITGFSMFNSAIGTYEDWAYKNRIANAKIERPVFILGHMRSGTTFLYNLMAIDKRFAFPTLWQAFNPHTFLSTEFMNALVKRALPETRKMDNVRLNVSNPIEDRIAVVGSMSSPALRLVFPRSGDYYEQYLTFRGSPQEDVERWKHSLSRFYQKLMVRNQGKTLLIKSPQHMGRIKLLLDMFPDARFVHIYRNPYSVFKSSRKLVAAAAPTMRLQRPEPWDVDSIIIKRYQDLFGAYFDERSLIPPGNLYEMAFEDLEKDPLAQVKGIYQALDLPDFEVARPALEQYVGTLKGYRKNSYSELPLELRQRLSNAWRNTFEEWGYPCEQEQEYAVATA